jgi:glutaminyl-peptide cyclotransferase
MGAETPRRAVLVTKRPSGVKVNGRRCQSCGMAMARGMIRPASFSSPVGGLQMARLTGGISLVILFLVAGGVALMLYPWAGKAEATKTEGDKFAQDRTGGAVPFDAKRAMGYLDDICKIGPRISGSDGMKKQQELLTKHFEDKGGKVALQKFTAKQPGHETVEMTNIIVSWQPDKERRVIVCSHYDTRPIADQEPMRKRWQDPFISANDGGSGVALLMELANHMKDLKTNVGVDFVFFDGEEMIYDPERGKNEYFFGSKHFAAEYRKARQKRDAKAYVGAILLDMVGGKKAKFPVEQNSWSAASGLVKDVYLIADELKCPAFRGDEYSKWEVEDDHIALNKAGIPAIDIIDFDYEHWHRLSDLPENCSGESLEQVAKVVSVWIQRVK